MKRRALATGMGLSQTAAADMSTTLVQLGADMASFKNIGIDEVNAAMTAVFTGETESLKRLGIVMTQTNLQQFALTQGITQNISEMSQAEQVQLRYNYVLAMTKNAQGDFARTGGNLANQTRALGESIKQMGNEFGAVLVPAVTKVVSALREGVQGISQMDDGTKRMIVAVGMVVAAVGPLLLVGGKVITMIASIKTAMASLTINPWVLGIGAAVAAIAGLSLAMKALEPEVDTTSDSYQSLKRSIEGGAQGEVSIDATDLEELDASKLDELPDEVDISITADGEQALQDAKSIVETLDTDPQFDGKLAIDGDPQKAEQVIADIKADIIAVEEAVKIGGDPKEANEAIAQLENDLAELKRAVPITEDPDTQAALNQRITELTAKIQEIKGSITMSYSTEGEDGLESLKQKLKELPKDKTYKNTGEFVVSGMGAEAIQEYAEALAAAASATGDYKEAVESLNQLVDQDTQRKTGEVNQQLAEQYRYLTAQYNDGILTEEQYTQQVSEANEAATEKIKSIQKEAEVQKKLNEQLANGTRKDDAKTTAEQLKTLFADEHISAEEGMQAGRRILNDEYSEGDATAKQIDAGTQLIGMVNQQKEAYQGVVAAVQEYNAAMAEANNLEQNGGVTESGTSAQDALERAQVEREALDLYAAQIQSNASPEDALSAVVDTFSDQLSAYEGLEESLRGLLSGENGQGLTLNDMPQKTAEMDALIDEYQGKVDTAADEAQTKRQEALSNLQSTLSAINTGYTEAETNAMLSQIEGAGVSIDEATQALLSSAPDLIGELATALEGGDSSQIQTAIDGILANVDLTSAGEETGGNVAQGLADGMTNGTDSATSAGQELGESAVDAVNSGAGCASPSTKTEETGRNLIAGLVNGLQDLGTVTAAAQAIGAAVVAALQTAVAKNNLSSALGASVRTAVSNASSIAAAGGQSVGTELIGGASEGVSSGNNLSSAIGSAVRSASSSAGSTASSAGRSIGSNLMAGVRSGIQSAVSSVVAAARSAVQQAVSAAKAAANINSPSGVMRDEVGVMLMRGVEVGMSERTPTTLQMIQESMRGLISGATAVVNSNGIPAPAVAIPTPGGTTIDYERLADANASRPVILNVGAKRMAQATRDEAARQQAIRVAQINAGYGGR